MYRTSVHTAILVVYKAVVHLGGAMYRSFHAIIIGMNVNGNCEW